MPLMWALFLDRLSGSNSNLALKPPYQITCLRALYYVIELGDRWSYGPVSF